MPFDRPNDATYHADQAGNRVAGADGNAFWRTTDDRSRWIAVGTCFNGTYSSLFEIAASLYGIASKADALTPKVDAAATQTAALNPKIDTISQKLDTLIKKVEAVAGAVDVLNRRIDMMAVIANSAASGNLRPDPKKFGQIP